MKKSIEAVEGQTLADFGFRDNPRYTMGLANAPVVSLTTEHPTTGNPTRLLAVNYPVNGLGFEYLLRGAVPEQTRRFHPLERRGTVDDWAMPDKAGSENQDLHERHMRFPAYASFHESHRTPWLERLSITDYDPLFRALWETKFVEPNVFAAGRVAKMHDAYITWKAENEDKPPSDRKSSPAHKINMHRYNTSDTPPEWQALERFLHDELVGDPQKQALVAALEMPASPAKYDTLSGYREEFYQAYLDHITKAPIELQMSSLVNSFDIHSNIVCIDPVTGKRWTATRGETPAIDQEGVSVTVAEMSAHILTDKGSAALTFGDVLEDGEYAVSHVDISYPNDYSEGALFPLVAVEDTPKGRRFLTQEEADALLPGSLQNAGLDVGLGAIVTAHCQPEVVDTFPTEMAIPGDPTLNAEGKKPTNAIMAAQIPVLVFAKPFSPRLLENLPKAG